MSEDEARIRATLALVKLMRDAQKDYFRGPNGDKLIRSKELERQVDERLKLEADLSKPSLFKPQ